MKLSLRWIFDHIDEDYKKVDIKNLVDKFNKITAEIEGYEKLELDLSKFFIVKIESVRDIDNLLKENKQISSTCADFEVGSSGLLASCAELGKEICLSARKDAVIGQLYIVKKIDNDDYCWAQVSDFGCQKDGLIPAIYVSEQELAGSWKNNFEYSDYIIEVDNKSITHRPDMWGHRGFAREIAAFLDLKFKKEDEFLKKFEVKEFEDLSQDEQGFRVKVENHDICKRFAGVYLPEIKNRPSSLWMASRLMRIGSRPIDCIVDITNYVMNDISQPMHAFDVEKLCSKSIIARIAVNGEKLELLDGCKLELTNKDYVITDGKNPVALAGVMGGKNSAIDSKTNSIFIESANFESSSIRNSAIRAKNRTDASARFEKTLDPNQNILGLFRLFKIFEQENIEHSDIKNIMSIGKSVQRQEVILSHELIEKLIGAKISSEFVVSTLTKLDFQVSKIDDLCYKILIPTFRSSKDIEIKEDIVEEIGRFFGYENTDFVLPKKFTTSYDLSVILRSRNIKKVLSHGLKMREVRNYAFYDESFLSKIKWVPKFFEEVTNPVSDNWKKLVTSLVPHLIKNIDHNFVHNDKLSFFEYARTWNIDGKHENGISEKRVFAGIFYQKKDLDFYASKYLISGIFDLLGMEVKWERPDAEFLKEKAPWFFEFQTAKILVNDKFIGHAGMLDRDFFGHMFEGDLFAFEFDAEFLIEHKFQEKKFTQISRFPEVSRDISIFIPISISVENLLKAITGCDEKIKNAYLLDFFQKDEWKDKKSLTFRFIVQDYNKTLEKDEVEIIYEKVSCALQDLGAQVR